MATTMVDEIKSAANGEYDRPQINGGIASSMTTHLGWQTSNGITSVTPRQNQTWKPADGIVFAKKRITTWKPSNGIVFASQSSPSNVSYNQPIGVLGLKKTFASSASLQSRISPRGSRGSILPPPRIFNAAEQRKPDLPPVKIEDDENDPNRAITPDERASAGQAGDAIPNVKDKSFSSMVSRPSSSTNINPSSGLSPRGGPSETRKKEVRDTSPTVGEKGRTRHTQPLPELEVSSARQDRSKAPVISDKAPEEQTQTSRVMMLKRPNLPTREAPTAKIKAMSPSREGPAMDLLTVENFMLSKEEIDRWHDKPALTGNDLINALSHRQREILLRLRTQRVTLEDCFSLCAESLEEYEKVFANAKLSLRALVRNSKTIIYDLQDLITVGQHSPFMHDQNYARGVFSIAELQFTLLANEIPGILHALRFYCRSRFRLYFDFLQLQLQSPEISSRNVLVPADHSDMKDLQAFTFKTVALLQRMNGDLMDLEDFLAYHNRTMAQNRPMSAAMNDFFVQRKEQLGLIPYVLDAVIQDVRGFPWLCIINEPLYLHTLQSLTKRQEAIAFLFDRWTIFSSIRRELSEDLATVLGPIRYRLGQQAKGAERPLLKSILRRVNFAHSSLSAGITNLKDAMLLMRSIQRQFTYSGLDLRNVLTAVRQKRVSSKRRSINTASDIRMINGATSPWSHRLYRDAEGNTVETYYTNNSHHPSAREVIGKLRDANVIGFDLEWSPFAKVTDSAHKNVSMIQLATDKIVALFHVALHPDKIGNMRSGAWQPVSHGLRRVLENPRILKVGVNIKNDCTRLRKHLGIYVQGAIELSHLHNQLEYHLGKRKTLDRKVSKLSDLVRKYFDMELPKGDIRMSDWSEEIVDPEAIHYAAADAYAGLRLFHVLESKRQALNPTPDRPFPVEFENAIPCATSVQTDELAVVSRIEPKEGYDTPSLQWSSDIDASLFDPRDSGPIEMVGFENTAWKFARYICRRWNKKYGYAFEDKLASYIAWHFFSLDIGEISKQRSRLRRSTIRNVEVEQDILETLKRYNLPFNSGNLSRILLPSLTEAPMPTIEILRLQKVLRKQRNLLEPSSPSTFPPAGKERFLAFGLWEDRSLSLGQISLTLHDHPLTVVGWIRDALELNQNSSSLNPLERKLFHGVYLLKGFPEGESAPGVHQDGKPFVIVDHPHILNLKRSSSVDDINEAIRRQRLAPTSAPNLENVTRMEMYGRDEPAKDWIEQKAILRPEEDLLQRVLPGWGALAEDILSDDFEMHRPQDESTLDENVIMDNTDIPSKTSKSTEALTDIERAWDDCLDADAAEIPWDSLQVSRTRSRSKSPRARGRRRRPAPDTAHGTSSRSIVRRTPSGHHR